jgi:hypothetical protein
MKARPIAERRTLFAAPEKMDNWFIVFMAFNFYKPKVDPPEAMKKRQTAKGPPVAGRFRKSPDIFSGRR